MTVNFGMKPNIKGWFEEITSKFNLIEAVFFADFSHKSLADEIQRIRPFSNKIIDTRSPKGVQKDYTDFIILDNIYQKAMMSEGIEVFILFSGDGHFSSATSFLKNICGKEVGIYAIKGSFSRQLQETSNWCVALPTDEELYGNDFRLIFGILKNAKGMITAEVLIGEVLKTSKTTKKQNLDEILKRLQNEGIVAVRTVGKTKNVLFTDWERAEKSGYMAELS